MTGSTTVTLLSDATTLVGGAFTDLLPIVVPVAISLAILYGVLHWLLGASRRKI